MQHPITTGSSSVFVNGKGAKVSDERCVCETRSSALCLRNWKQRLSEIESKIDEAASTAASAFQAAQDEINNAVNQLQTIEIPELPKLNLQAEIQDLLTLTEGTPSLLLRLQTSQQNLNLL